MTKQTLEEKRARRAARKDKKRKTISEYHKSHRELFWSKLLDETFNEGKTVKKLKKQGKWPKGL